MERASQAAGTADAKALGQDQRAGATRASACIGGLSGGGGLGGRLGPDLAAFPVLHRPQQTAWRRGSGGFWGVTGCETQEGPGAGPWVQGAPTLLRPGVCCVQCPVWDSSTRGIWAGRALQKPRALGSGRGTPLSLLSVLQVVPENLTFKLSRTQGLGARRP